MTTSKQVTTLKQVTTSKQVTTLKQVERLHKVIYKNLHTINSTLDYNRIIECFTLLGDLVCNVDDEDGDLWYIGEHLESLDTMIIGAYWHFTEWHAGQNSTSYEALSSLGGAYTPNCDMLDEDNYTYQLLNGLASKHYSRVL